VRGVKEGVLRDGVGRRQLVGVVEKRPIPVEHGRMAAGTPVDEFQQRSRPDRRLDPPDLLEGDVEVVFGEQPLGLVRVALSETRRRVVDAHRTGTGEPRQLREVFGAGHGEVAAVPRHQRVGGGVEQITAERDREREHHRMTGPEEVDRTIRVEPSFRGRHRLDDVGVAVGVEQRHHRPDWEHVQLRGRRVPPGRLSHVRVRRSLYRRVEQHLARRGVRCVGERALRRGEFALDAVAVGVRRGRDVDGRRDVAADPPLELENLGGGDVDVAVLGQLERSRIGHDRAVEPQELVKPLREHAVADAVGAADDVGVGYQQLRAERRPEPLRLDREHVGVDDRQQRRRLDGEVRAGNLEPPDPAGGVVVSDLEVVAHMPTPGSRAVSVAFARTTRRSGAGLGPPTPAVRRTRPEP